MKFLTIILLIYVFLKGIYYGVFELKEKENKTAGITSIFLAILGLILPITILFIYY